MPYENPNGMKPPLDIDLFEIDSIESRFVIRIRPETLIPSDDLSFVEVSKKDILIKYDDVFIIDFDRFIYSAFAFCNQNAYKRLGKKLISLGQNIIDKNSGE